jgi:hypothetical protein
MAIPAIAPLESLLLPEVVLLDAFAVPGANVAVDAGAIVEGVESGVVTVKVFGVAFGVTLGVVPGVVVGVAFGLVAGVVLGDRLVTVA